MKVKLFTVALTALLPMACGQEMQQAKEAVTSTSGGAMTGEEQAANELYLEDVEDSAADETSATDAATSEDASEDASEEVDASVIEDTKDRRLDQMVEMVMTERDSDASGDLSLAEFIARPGKDADGEGPSADVVEKITAKLTVDFNKYAGDDALLSAEELKTLLKESGPRVGRHRHKHFPGQHEQRVKQTWEQLVAKYDTDGDGLLNQQEFEAMEADREASRQADGPGRGGPRGEVDGERLGGKNGRNGGRMGGGGERGGPRRDGEGGPGMRPGGFGGRLGEGEPGVGGEFIMPPPAAGAES